MNEKKEHSEWKHQTNKYIEMKEETCKLQSINFGRKEIKSRIQIGNMIKLSNTFRNDNSETTASCTTAF